MLVVVVVIVIMVATMGFVMFNAISTPPPIPVTSSTGSPATSSTTSGSGLRLTESINGSTITVGQRVNVSLSISNTLPAVNTVLPSNEWSFQGVPVALWPPCYFDLPAQAVVLKGNYSSKDLQSVANVPFGYDCMEGVTIDHVIFQPSSDQVNLTGIYHGGTTENQTLGPFITELNFTTAGYWNLTSLAGEVNSPIIGEIQSTPPAYTAFTPGVYTVAVADEWGQAAVLHFIVSSSASGSSSTSASTTITNIVSGPQFSIEDFGPLVSLSAARQLISFNFTVPTNLPDGLQLAQIRGGENLIYLIFSSPVLSNLPSWGNASMLEVIARDNTSYEYSTSVVTITQYCSTTTQPSVTASCSSTSNTESIPQTAGRTDVLVSGYQGWGYDPVATTGQPGFLTWWNSDNGLHYSLSVDLPLSTLVNIAGTLNN